LHGVIFEPSDDGTLAAQRNELDGGLGREKPTVMRPPCSQQRRISGTETVVSAV
jgi:hypothetical protein